MERRFSAGAPLPLSATETRMVLCVIRALRWVVFWLALLVLLLPALPLVVEALDKLPAAARKSVTREIELPLPPTDFI